jgi:hypothetical protein
MIGLITMFVCGYYYVATGINLLPASRFDVLLGLTYLEGVIETVITMSIVYRKKG